MGQIVAVKNFTPFDASFLSGAKGLYVTPTPTANATADYYRVALWMAFPLIGQYHFDLSVPQLTEGYLSVDGVQVAALVYPFGAQDIARGTIDIEIPKVVRIDILYRVGVSGATAYAQYRVVDSSDLLVAISDATGATGMISTDSADTIPDSELGPEPIIPVDRRFQYPLWPYSPNWRYDVAEALTWLTDVMGSETAAEQRRRLRSNPRRSVEATFTRWGDKEQLTYNMIGGIGTGNMLLPLWWASRYLNQPASEGDTLIYVDTQNVEWFVGSVAVIWADDPYDYQLVVVTGISEGELLVHPPLGRDSAPHSSIVPVRTAQLWDSAAMNAITSGVGEKRLRFNIVEYYAEPADWGGTVYGETGLPVVSIEPNWSSGLDMSMGRNVFILDNEVGNVLFTDPTNQPRIQMRCTYQVHDDVEMRDFRKVIHAMQGRYKAFHAPTYKDDFNLAADISASEGALIVQRCGYTQFNNATRSVFRYIMIEKHDGTRYYNSIISSRVVGDVEWLYLATTFGNHQKSQIKRICYAPKARLDIDNVEFSRLTNTVARTALTFLLFDDRRAV